MILLKFQTYLKRLQLFKINTNIQMGCFETKMTICSLCFYCLTTNFLIFENHSGSVRFLEMISNSQGDDVKNLELFKDISGPLKFHRIIWELCALYQIYVLELFRSMFWGAHNCLVLSALHNFWFPKCSFPPWWKRVANISFKSF